jgi:LysR family glycine cleavage system transcriptional activator
MRAMPARRTPRRPPLGGIVAFDAILRHGSFTAAADELALTQSAISHRIGRLEHHYGRKLLHRLNPGLKPTAAGAKLARQIAPVLEAIYNVDLDDTEEVEARPFRLGVGQALLTLWLSPRLPALTAAFPRQPIEIAVLSRAADAARRDLDLMLLWLPRRDIEADERMLAFPDETVFPVAAPALLRGARGEAWRELDLIDKRAGDADGAAREWSWREWLGENPPRRPALTFRELTGSLQAAMEGQGVALTRSLLAADAVRTRRLLPTVPPERAKPCSKVQIARWHAEAHPQAAEVAAWLVKAARLSLAAGADLRNRFLPRPQAGATRDGAHP